MTYVYLGLGANIQPHTSLQAGVAELIETFGTLVQSPVYIAQAVGMDGPDFLNMAVGFECPMTHTQLMSWIRATETKHGRQRPSGLHPKPTSHGLDMDLLLFGDMVDEGHKVPRPEILTCAYVLQPLADIAPDLIHPTKAKSIQQLFNACDFEPRLKLADICF
ncbi:MAG: 2-amino-4-hydroxy-6-hydroxymethyldihydropteridine diphosphokinase [Oceanospirillaceae bacterium]|nr:2-amino-4-hydroxy-6-hydroxymethyldihydropteridine diphosphokinase [Oceanospirillaceae bacterium]